MACNIQIILNNQVVKTVHSDEELDDWLYSHPASLEAILSGTGKIFSFSSLDEASSKMKDILAKGKKMGANKKVSGFPDTGLVSVGITSLYSEFGRYKNYGQGIINDTSYEEDNTKSTQPGIIKRTDVGTEVDQMIGALIEAKPIPTPKTFSTEVATNLRTELTGEHGFIQSLYDKYGVTDPDKQVFYQAQMFTQNFGNALIKELSESKKPVGALKRLANEINTIEAIPDLLIIDKDGVVHVIDFKTTGLDTSNWLQTKNSYVAQVASYREILRDLGFTMGDAVLATFKATYTTNAQNEVTQVNSISVGEQIVIPNTHPYVKVARDFFSRSPEVENATLGEVSKLLSEAFPGSEVGNELTPTDVDIDYMKEKIIRKVRPNTEPYEKGYRFVFYRKSTITGFRNDLPVYGKTKSELTDDTVDASGKVVKSPLKQYVEQINARKQQRFLDFGKDLKHAIQDTSVQEFENTIDYIAPGNHNTIMHTFKRYIQCGWNFQENEKLNANGIYLFTKGEKLEIVVIDEGHQINKEVKLPLGTSVLGTFVRDGSLTDTRTIMKATYGNLMLMKALALVALDPKLTENRKISSIRALNIHQSHVYDENNSRLIENWNAFAFRYKEATGKRLRNLGYNTFMNDADALVDIADEYIETLSLINGKSENRKNLLVTQRDMSEELIKRKLDLLRAENRDLYDIRNKEYGRPEWDAFAYLERALLAIHNFHIFQEKDLGRIFNGIALTGIDMRSFGSSTSPLARQAAEMMSYYRTAARLKFLEEQTKWSKLLEAAYKEEGWSGIIGNDWRFFEKWFKHDKDGKIDTSFTLVDPSDLKAGESSKKALQFLLETNAKYRWPDLSLDEAKLQDEYYEMPLFLADSIEMLVGEGPLAALKTSWKKAKNLGIELVFGKEVSAKTREQLSEMSLNLPNVAWSDESERRQHLEENGPMHYERNLDTLMLTIIQSGVRTEVGPRFCEFFTAFMVVADYMQKTQGLDIDNIRKALNNFVQSKLFGHDIRDPENQTLNAIIGMLKGMTASIALGWNTRAFFREGLTGIKKHFNRFISQMDTHERYGRPSFLTSDNFAEAYEDVMSRIASSKDEHSNFSIFSFYHQLNAIYGMVNFSFEEMNHSSKVNQWTVLGFFGDKSMSTATGPDFLHRMAILGGHLRTIGAWDAYSLDEDGILRYDMTKDKRYETYLKYRDDEDSIPDIETRKKYQNEKQNYLQAIKSWQIVNPEIKEGDMLPQALSPQETLNVKQFADDLYGNYDEETKSIVQKQTLGSLFFQYKTYGLAQAAQWFAEPGYTNTLTWVDVTNKDGKRMVRVPVYNSSGYIEHGEFIDKPEDEVTEEEWAKGAFYWKQLGGNQFIGKLQTDWLVATHLFTLDSKEFNDFWNEHPLYRSQLYMSMLDLFELMLISLLLRLFWNTDETPIHQQDFLPRWTHGVLYGAAQDGPLFQTFSAIVGDGTPPVLGMLKNYYNTTISVINGNSNILYGLTKTVGTTRELSNLFKDL